MTISVFELRNGPANAPLCFNSLELYMVSFVLSTLLRLSLFPDPFTLRSEPGALLKDALSSFLFGQSALRWPILPQLKHFIWSSGPTF